MPLALFTRTSEKYFISHNVYDGDVASQSRALAPTPESEKQKKSSLGKVGHTTHIFCFI